MTTKEIKEFCLAGKTKWTQHLGKRMVQRRISPDEVIAVLTHGEIIEDYPTDYPFESCLLMAFVDGRPLHVVCSIGNGLLWIITAYQPNPAEWVLGFKKRLKGVDKS